MTQFQLQCEAALVKALKAAGISVDVRVDAGVTESFIRLKLQDSDVELFIYGDEAGIQGSGTDLRFETPDYDCPATLIDAFVSAAISVAKNRK